MAATNQSGSGKKNYYNVSYGKLSNRTKDIPEGYTEMAEADLKSMTQKVQNIDLRNKYVEKSGEYPYAVFYDMIEGQIVSISKNEFDKGTSLQLEIVDSDGDDSIIQCKFYSKYTENILNRFCNMKNITEQMTFTPYAIPSEFEIEGNTINMYNQGVSLKLKGVKVESKYAKETLGDMPGTERVMNSEGKEQTSRVKRINFLFDEVMSKFNKSEKSVPSKEAPASSATTQAPAETATEDEDDLPF